MDRDTPRKSKESYSIWPASPIRRASMGIGTTTFVLNAAGAISATALQAYHFANMVALEYASCAVPLDESTEDKMQAAARAHENITDQAANASFIFLSTSIGSAVLVAAGFYKRDKE